MMHVKPRPRIDRRGHDALILAKLREHYPTALAEASTALTAADLATLADEVYACFFHSPQSLYTIAGFPHAASGLEGHLVVFREAGAGRDQSPHDDVFLESSQVIF